MTRLTQEHLSAIDLLHYDQELQEKSGKSLTQLAWELSGLPQPLEELPGEKVAVVPVTVGKGLISGFTDAVSSVLTHLGLETNITSCTDIAGLGEAVANGATVLFCADDQLFLALDLRRGRYIDNAKATAEMFMFTVEQMAGGMQEKKVLIIGMGKVGLSCLNFALKKKAIISIHDTIPERCTEAGSIFNSIHIVYKNLEKACREAEIIIDASPGEQFIPADWLRDEVYIGAPGVPLGLTDAAYKKFWQRIIHDPLPLGVAGMAASIFGTRYL